MRAALGIRTVFNVLGPLANPAGACDGVFGVYSAALAMTYAEALAELGARRAFVVHGSGGLDELSPFGTSLVVEIVDGDVREWVYNVLRLPVTVRRPPAGNYANWWLAAVELFARDAKADRHRLMLRFGVTRHA